jgi:hypothetical protein
MSGVSINLDGTVGCLSGSGVVPMSTADNFENAEPSILASPGDMHRITKAGISFGKLSMVERKQFHKESVDQALSCKTGDLSASEAARRVALMYNINIVECDKAKIKVTVYSRIRASKALDDIDVVVPSEPVVATTANIGHAAMGAKRRPAGADGAIRPAAKRVLMPATCYRRQSCNGRLRVH